MTATVLHPGVVRTSFGAEDQAAYFAVMTRVARLFMKAPAQGADTPIYHAPIGFYSHQLIFRLAGGSIS